MTATRTALFLALALSAGPAFAQQDISKVNGSITAESGQTAGRPANRQRQHPHRTAARVTDDAGTVNGSITVNDESHHRLAGNRQRQHPPRARRDRRMAVSKPSTAASSSDRGGKVRNNVETVNGAIGLVGTQLGGGIETVNGDITVGIDSTCKGGIKIEKRHGMATVASPSAIRA